MTAIVKPEKTALETRFVSIAWSDQNADNVCSGQSLTAAAATPPADTIPTVRPTRECGRRRPVLLPLCSAPFMAPSSLRAPLEASSQGETHLAGLTSVDMNVKNVGVERRRGKSTADYAHVMPHAYRRPPGITAAVAEHEQGS
jgi:hypothetical protein